MDITIKKLEQHALISQLLKEQIQYVSSLPPSIKDSLKEYTIDSSDINNYYRGKDKRASQETIKHAKNIDIAFEYAPPINFPIQVFRGQSIKDFDTRAVTSTSSNIYTPIEFMSSGRKCCFFSISVSARSKVLPLVSISENPNEFEILLERDGFFECTDEDIIDIGYEKEVETIFLTYTPPKSITVDDGKELKKALSIIIEDKIEDDVKVVLDVMVGEIELLNEIEEVNIQKDFDSILKSSYEQVSRYKKISPLNSQFKKLAKERFKM